MGPRLRRPGGTTGLPGASTRSRALHSPRRDHSTGASILSWPPARPPSAPAEPATGCPRRRVSGATVARKLSSASSSRRRADRNRWRWVLDRLSASTAAPAARCAAAAPGRTGSTSASSVRSLAANNARRGQHAEPSRPAQEHPPVDEPAQQFRVGVQRRDHGGVGRDEHDRAVDRVGPALVALAASSAARERICRTCARNASSRSSGLSVSIASAQMAMLAFASTGTVRPPPTRSTMSGLADRRPPGRSAG